MSIRALIRRLTGRPDPVPRGTSQRIQADEQQAARRRILDQAQRLRDSRLVLRADADDSGRADDPGPGKQLRHESRPASRIAGGPWWQHGLDKFRQGGCIKVAVRVEALYDALAG